MNLARPLDRFPLVRARHIEGAREALCAIYSNDMVLEPTERGSVVEAVINNCQLSQIGLNYSGYGGGVHVEFTGSKFITLSFPIGGGHGVTVVGGRERLLGPRCGLVTPADTGFAAELSEHYEHVVLRLDPHALQSKLAAILGRPIDGPLQFDPLLEFSGTHAQLLKDHFFFLVDTVSNAEAPVPRLLQVEFEEAVMAMFLRVSRHNYSHLLGEDAPVAAPAEVRRAEDYIESNWRTPIALEDLAAITGVSALSLFRSFKKYRGYTPAQFAERVRARKQNRC